VFEGQWLVVRDFPGKLFTVTGMGRDQEKIKTLTPNLLQCRSAPPTPAAGPCSQNFLQGKTTTRETLDKRNATLEKRESRTGSQAGRWQNPTAKSIAKDRSGSGEVIRLLDEKGSVDG